MVTVTGTSYSLAGLDPRQAYYTTTQPFSYRDTLTVLGRMNRVIDNLEIVRQRVEQVADKEQSDIDGLKGEWAQWAKDAQAMLDEFDDRLKGFQGALDDLKELVGDGGSASEKLYDPTHGRTGDSEHVMRDVFRELAVFGARVSDLATVSVADAADHDCLTWSVMGNRSILGHAEPRVTPTGN